MTNTIEKNEKFEQIENSHWGSETFYRHPFRRCLIMTSGIKDFIEKFECMWLFDEMAIAIDRLVKENYDNNDLFNVISVTAKNGKVDIDIKHDTDRPVFYHKHIAYSDLEDGLYETWLIGTPKYDESKYSLEDIMLGKVKEEPKLIGIEYTWLLKSEY